MSLRSLIYVDAQNLEGVQTALFLHERKARVALIRAINKTARWAGSQARHQIASQYGLPFKSLKGRIRTTPATPDKAHAYLTFDISPVRAIFAGARQNKLGVQAGGHFLRSAFIAKPYGLLNVFKRKGKARFPVIVQKIPIEGAKSILTGITQQVPGHLRTVFRQELNYELNVRGRR